MAAKTVTLTDEEQVVVRSALQLLRSSNARLEEVANEVNYSMGATANATRNVIHKLDNGNVRRLAERATQE